MQVLLIEPDRLLAKTYYDALQQAGHNVAVCADAQQAVQAADQTNPDIVVMELQLVSHSGIEFLYEFRTYVDWMNIPVIVHTHVPPGEFADAREVLMHDLGVSEYLYKPHASLQKLISAVGERAPVE